MLETKTCPNCGTINKGLDLVETQGVYVCNNCKRIIDTMVGKTESDQDIDVDEE